MEEVSFESNTFKIPLSRGSRPALADSCAQVYSDRAIPDAYNGEEKQDDCTGVMSINIMDTRRRPTHLTRA